MMLLYSDMLKISDIMFILINLLANDKYILFKSYLLFQILVSLTQFLNIFTEKIFPRQQHETNTQKT
jgi:hypothetical protein